MRVYLAAPLFTQAEQEFNLKVAQALRDAGHDVFVPQESQPDFGIGWQQNCFRCDVDGLDWCEVVAAVLDGPDVDSGTAWECGYTWGRGKVVFGLRTDLRTLGDEGAVNLMLERSCRMCKTVAELVASVDDEAARAHEAHGE